MLLFLGMGIPVGIIYLIGLTKFKIEGRADIEKLTSLPVVGDIPLADEKTGSIAVFENQNNLMSETFVMFVPIFSLCLKMVRM